MVLLVLNYEYPPIGGGAAPVAQQLTERLASFFDKVIVVTSHYKELPFEESLENITVFRVPCFRKERMRSRVFEQLVYVVRSYILIKRRFKNNYIDICHTHFIVPTGLLALLLKRKLGLEYILTAHGSDVPGHNKQNFKLLHKLILPLTKMITKEAKRVVFPSKYLMKTAENTIGNGYKNYMYIPNGIDPRLFSPRNKDKSIIAVGRLIRLKGFSTLIRAISGEDIGYTIHIVGDGPLKHELQQLAKDSKTKVLVHGWLDNSGKEFKKLIEQASVFCLPSESENASISLLEGMAAGCAIITTDNPGSVESVGQAGKFFQFGNEMQLLVQIKNCIQNNAMMIKMQNEARERVEKVFNIDSTLASYSEILNK